MQYLLDTDIMSDLIRRRDGPVARRLAVVGDRSVATSIIVAAELRFGAAKKQSPSLEARVKMVLDATEILPFESPADVFYAELRAGLERTGRTIGANDLLIAAHALTLGMTLVTNNEREFSRIGSLTVESWLR